MNENVQFWDEVFDELDKKYVSEASEKLFRHQGKEKKLVEIVVDGGSDKPRGKWRSFAGIAAAVVLGISGIGVIGGLITGNFSVLREQTLDFDLMKISAGSDYREVEITPDSENADTAKKLLEVIDSMTYAATALDVYDVENHSFYSVFVSYDGEVTHNIKLGKKFTGAEKHYYRISDDIVTEISMTEYEKAEELILSLTENAMLKLNSGRYFSSEVDGTVYLEVTDDKIELCGDSAYAFVEKYGSEIMAQSTDVMAETVSYNEQLSALHDEYKKVHDESAQAQEQLSALHDEYKKVYEESVQHSDLSDENETVVELRREEQDILSEIRDSEIQLDGLMQEQGNIMSEIRQCETQLDALNVEQANALNEARIESEQLDELCNKLNNEGRADITSYIVMLKDGEDSTDYHSYFSGGNTIYVFGAAFKLEEAVRQAQFDSEYKLGHICFTDVVQDYRRGWAGVASPFESEREAEDYFTELTGCAGISRLSDTVIVEYELDLSESRYDGLAVTYGLPREVSLRYKNENGREILISAVETGGVHAELCLPDGTTLQFPEDNPDVKITTLLAPDGRTIELKTGGVYFADRNYLLAEWTDNGISYRVSTSKCYLWDFINTLIAIVVDADGVSDAISHYNRIETNLDSYKMELGLCFSHFIGFWSDGTEEIEIGANDNLFSYGENQLYGFYEDELGYYMSGSKGVWFIPADDTKSMYYYVTAAAVSESPRAIDYYKRYEKVAEGDMVMADTNCRGVIGMHYYCYWNSIDYDSLYNFSFTDENGRTWYRVPDGSADWGKMYVDNFTDSTIFLKMKSGEEMKYFSCHFEEIDGQYVMTDEHHPYDVSVLTHEGLPSELSARYYVERGTEAYDEMGLRSWLSIQFYPLSDGSYYAIRAVGHDQSQFVNGYEIFYNDGNGYSRVDGTFTGFLGTFFHELENDRIYALHTKDSELAYGYELVVSCISGDKVTASLSLGEIEGFVKGIDVQGGIVSVNFWVLNTVVDKLFVVDFTDIYNPVLNEIRIITEGEAAEQQPLEGYDLLSEAGEKLPDDSINNLEPEEQMYYAPFYQSQCGGFISRIAYKNGEVMILGGKDNEGIELTEGGKAEIIIIPDFSAAYNDGEGERAEIGYIYDGYAHSVYTGIIPPDGFRQLIEIEKSGNYKFYIVNLCAELQNYQTVDINAYNSEGVPMGFGDISETCSKLSLDTGEASAEIDCERLYQDVYEAHSFSMAAGESLVLTYHDYMPFELKAGDEVVISFMTMTAAYYTESDPIVRIGYLSDENSYAQFEADLEIPPTKQYKVRINNDGGYKFVITNSSDTRVNFAAILIDVPHDEEKFIEKLWAFNEIRPTDRIYGEFAVSALVEEIGDYDAVFPLDEKYRIKMRYDGKYYCPAGAGEKVYSMTDGTVIETDFYSSFGHGILVEFEENRYLFYHHLDDDIAVSAGDTISAGNLIGYAGTSGFTDESALGISVYDMPKKRYE